MIITCKLCGTNMNEEVINGFMEESVFTCPNCGSTYNSYQGVGEWTINDWDEDTLVEAVVSEMLRLEEKGVVYFGDLESKLPDLPNLEVLAQEASEELEIELSYDY